MRYLDLASLRTIVAIGDEKTFEGAARAIHRTQSAVSQQVRKLEQQLNLRLFDRVGRNNVMTSEGMTLVMYARRILALHDEMAIALYKLDEPEIVRIGAPADMADSLLPDMLRMFARIHQTVTMKVHVGRSPELMEELRDGRLDITISTRWDQSQRHIILRNSPVVWIASPGFRLAPHETVPLVLTDEPSIFRRIALDALERSGRPWKIRYESPEMTGIKAAIRASIGVTARNVEMLDSDMVILGEREGLPPLGNMNFYLYIGQGAKSEAAKALFNLMSARMGQGGE